MRLLGGVAGHCAFRFVLGAGGPIFVEAHGDGSGVTGKRDLDHLSWYTWLPIASGPAAVEVAGAVIVERPIWEATPYDGVSHNSNLFVCQVLKRAGIWISPIQYQMLTQIRFLWWIEAPGLLGC